MTEWEWAIVAVFVLPAVVGWALHGLYSDVVDDDRS